MYKRQELKEAENSRAPELLDALRRAAENIADFHRRQVQQSWMETKKDGVILGQRIRGLQLVGLYVPGGTAAYPSSVPVSYTHLPPGQRRRYGSC